MDNQLTLDSIGLFTWGWTAKFHIEVMDDDKKIVGNFEWSDPNYGGDNTIKPTVGIKEWIKKERIKVGRDKGKHKIKDYCGSDVKIIK